MYGACIILAIPYCILGWGDGITKTVSGKQEGIDSTLVTSKTIDVINYNLSKSLWEKVSWWLFSNPKQTCIKKAKIYTWKAFCWYFTVHEILLKIQILDVFCCVFRFLMSIALFVAQKFLFRFQVTPINHHACNVVNCNCCRPQALWAGIGHYCCISHNAHQSPYYLQFQTKDLILLIMHQSIKTFEASQWTSWTSCCEIFYQHHQQTAELGKEAMLVYRSIVAFSCTSTSPLATHPWCSCYSHYPRLQSKSSISPQPNNQNGSLQPHLVLIPWHVSSIEFVSDHLLAYSKLPLISNTPRIDTPQH